MSQSVSQSVKKTYMEGTTSASSCTQTYHIQPSTCSSSRLTPTEPVALFEVKLQFVKVPLFTMKTAPPCKQVTRTNQPTTYTYTNTHTNNCQSIHACMHSFNSTSPLHHSFTRTNEPRITIAIHHNHPSIHQPCIARYHSVWHSYMHASRCHGSHTMECICMHTACQPPPYRETYTHTCMHAQR